MSQSNGQGSTVSKEQSSDKTEREEYVYQFRVSIIGSRPWIWRRCQVLESTMLKELGGAILKAVGWFWNISTNEYDCEFIPGVEEKRSIGKDPGAAIGCGRSIRTMFQMWGNPVEFVCSGEDGTWRHRVLLEKIIPREPEKFYPICIRGRMACPPSEFGNIEEYRKLLEMRGNMVHPNYADSSLLIQRLEEQNFDWKLFRNPKYIGSVGNYDVCVVKT